MADIFVYKNAIKPNYSPKWGNFGRVGNFVGIFDYFPGNSCENFLETLNLEFADRNEMESSKRKALVTLQCKIDRFYTVV